MEDDQKDSPPAGNTFFQIMGYEVLMLRVQVKKDGECIQMHESFLLVNTLILDGLPRVMGMGFFESSLRKR